MRLKLSSKRRTHQIGTHAHKSRVYMHMHVALIKYTAVANKKALIFSNGGDLEGRAMRGTSSDTCGCHTSPAG